VKALAGEGVHRVERARGGPRGHNLGGGGREKGAIKYHISRKGGLEHLGVSWPGVIHGLRRDYEEIAGKKKKKKKVIETHSPAKII